MAYIALPDSHWYRINSLPINSDMTFNKEIFMEGLRLKQSQAEDVLALLVTEVLQSGFLPHQNLMQQLEKNSISEAVDRVYEKRKDFYGWGEINQDMVKDYLLHGVNHRWTQKSRLSGPSLLSNPHLPKSNAGLVQISPSSQATATKTIDRRATQPENTENLSENNDSLLPVQLQLGSPIILRKHTRRFDKGDSSDAGLETPKLKKARLQAPRMDMSRDEPTVQQKLKKLRDEMREDVDYKREELKNTVKDLVQVETMLDDLVKEEEKLAEFQEKVNKTRERAAAMHTATTSSRAASKK